jgi:hypothetical protein
MWNLQRVRLLMFATFNGAARSGGRPPSFARAANDRDPSQTAFDFSHPIALLGRGTILGRRIAQPSSDSQQSKSLRRAYERRKRAVNQGKQTEGLTSGCAILAQPGRELRVAVGDALAKGIFGNGLREPSSQGVPSRISGTLVRGVKTVFHFSQSV